MDKEELSKYLAKLGAKGGKASAATLTKKERIERARKAGKGAKTKKGGRRTCKLESKKVTCGEWASGGGFDTPIRGSKMALPCASRASRKSFAPLRPNIAG